MKIAISGASGYIGQHLSRFLTRRGYEIIPLNRRILKEEHFDELCQSIECCNVVINLAGATINRRWTNAYKRELYDSRIPITRQLVRAIHSVNVKPQLLISTSAVGYYPTTGEYDEYNEQQGDSFLAQLCGDWEQEARACSADVRLVIARLGVVLSPDGGALAQMIRLQRLSHTGSIIAGGQQCFPWISVYDLCRAMDFIIQNNSVHGAINFTSPEIITQRELAVTLAKAYGVRWIIPIPEWMFKLIYGDAASFLTRGQNVRPTKLTESGFSFNYPTIERLLNITDRHMVL